MPSHVDDVGSTDPPFARFEHFEETTGAIQAGQALQRWHDMVDRHLFRHVRHIDPLAEMTLGIPPHRPLDGRLRSGRMGSLQYCRMWSSHGAYEHACLPRRAAQHAIVLQVGGDSVYETCDRSLLASDGERRASRASGE